MTAPLLALSPGDPQPRWFPRARARVTGLRQGGFTARIRLLKLQIEQRRRGAAPVILPEPLLVAPDFDPVSAPGYDLALVLSGGGARGFSHIGVLQVIQELQLPIDLVVGVSMGSIIGASYAAGLSAERMADLARSTRIRNIFRPRPGRMNLVDPTGLRAGLTTLFGDRRFSDLDRELVVVSSSMTTGEHFAIRDGPIVDAILSSCSIPLVFPPVSRDGHLLLDGGLIDGMPIAIARGLGARRIVAVDASTHARHVLRLPVVRHATRGVVSMLDRQHRRRPTADVDAVRIFSRVLHYATRHPDRPPVELLIRPAFGRRSTLHYHQMSDIVACGRAAAEVARPALAAFAAPAPTRPE